MQNTICANHFLYKHTFAATKNNYFTFESPHAEIHQETDLICRFFTRIILFFLIYLLNFIHSFLSRFTEFIEQVFL